LTTSTLSMVVTGNHVRSKESITFRWSHSSAQCVKQTRENYDEVQIPRRD
jgi:hypothetical protein